MKRRTSNRVKSEAEFLKIFDPDFLREAAEVDSTIAAAMAPMINLGRVIERAKARAEVAFKQREAVEDWAALDNMACVGAERPWREAACEYIWELSSIELRVVYADCTPEDFESQARLVVDVHSQKVYEEKVRLYERSFGTEGSKAAFLEYVKKQLDPRVRADCLERWQKRAAAISTISNAAPQLKSWNTDRSSAQSATGISESPPSDAVVQMLSKVIEKQITTFEDWAGSHRIARTTLFDWKRLRLAGKTLKGRVSGVKNAEIEKAVECDAKTLGLQPGPTRTDTDSSE